jgi:hypothetical protein
LIAFSTLARSLFKSRVTSLKSISNLNDKPRYGPPLFMLNREKPC